MLASFYMKEAPIHGEGCRFFIVLSSSAPHRQVLVVQLFAVVVYFEKKH